MYFKGSLFPIPDTNVADRSEAGQLRNNLSGGFSYRTRYENDPDCKITQLLDRREVSLKRREDGKPIQANGTTSELLHFKLAIGLNH